MSITTQLLSLLTWARIRGKPGLNVASGFVNRTDSVLAVSGAGVFSITPASTVYVIYSGGKKFTKNAAETVNITNDQTLHFVYFSTAGVLTVGTTPWDISGDAVPVALVYKDSTAYSLHDERHGYRRNRSWHEWAHDTIGARYESGFGGTFADTTFSIAQGAIHDEDLEFDSGGAKTACRLWYRNAALTAMRFESNITTPWKSNAGAPQYDNAGTMTNVPANRYFCSYFYATNDPDYPIYLVSGQGQYTNVASARNEANPTILLNTAEWKILYKVVYKQNGGSGDYVETIDFRNVSSGPAGTYTPTDHNSLVNRDAASSHPATAISNTPAGDVAATTVQDAIDELGTEKEPVLGNPATTGFVLSSTDAGVRSWVAQSGGSGDFLATLVNSEVTINGATTATINKMHLITDAASPADYSIALPAVSGNAGKFIGFRVSNAATKFFTIDPDGAEVIWTPRGEVSSRVYVRSETCILMCDGTRWHLLYETMLEVGFSAYRSTAQSISVSTVTPVELGTELWDIGGCFDNASTYRFLPDAPGMYLLSGAVSIVSLTDTKRLWCGYRMNGADLYYPSNVGASATQNVGVSFSKEQAFNGTTDYAELIIVQDSGTLNTNTGAVAPYFQARRLQRETS